MQAPPREVIKLRVPSFSTKEDASIVMAPTAMVEASGQTLATLASVAIRVKSNDRYEMVAGVCPRSRRHCYLTRLKTWWPFCTRRREAAQPPFLYPIRHREV